MADSSPTGRIRVAALDADRESYGLLDGLATPSGRVEFVGFLSTDQDLAAQLQRCQPDVLFLDGDDPTVDAVNRTEQVTVANLPVACILLWAHEDTRLIRHAMRAGAEDFLIKPFDAEQVGVQCAEAAAIVRERHPLGWQGGAPQSGAHYCQVSGFVCGKSGVGKTTLATNIAILFSTEMRRRTAVVDLQPGYAAVLLNLQPQRELQDLMDIADEMDLESVRAVAAEHDSGLHLYSWRLQPDFRSTYHIPAEFLQSTLQILAAAYDQIIVVFPRLAGDAALRALSIMDDVIVVTTGSDLLTLRDTKMFLDTIEDGYLTPGKIRIVLNRHGKTSSFTKEDVERTLHRSVTATVPSDYAVTSAAINMGIPFVTLKPSTQVAQSTRELAAILAGVGVSAKPEEPRHLFSVFARRDGEGT